TRRQRAPRPSRQRGAPRERHAPESKTMSNHRRTWRLQDPLHANALRAPSQSSISPGRGGKTAVTAPEIGLMVTPTLQLVRRLGGGGMGDVWLADHRALHTQVVVKFITSDLVTQKDAVERFSREAVAASQVKSPHVVQVLDHGVMEGGVPY